MSCPGERITGLVDAALPPEEQAAIEAHIETCPACREQASFERSLGPRLRALACPEPSAGLAFGIRAGLARERKKRRFLTVLLPLAAGLAFVAVWLRDSPALQAWALAWDHAHCFSRPTPPAKVLSSEPARIASWFEAQGTPLPRIPKGAAGLDLLGARYCPLADGSHAPHVYYVDGDRQVSLFLVRDGVRVRREHASTSRGLEVRLVPHEGRILGIVGASSDDVSALRRALPASDVAFRPPDRLE